MTLAANLPFDALATVCEFLTNASDVSSFSLICSSLRPVATRRLLSMAPIHLIGGPSVPRFHSFLFADTPARAPHVRALHIDLYGEEGCESPDEVWDEPVDAPLLIDILTSCLRIEGILIAFDSSLDPTTGHGPHIIRAIASLPALRSLSLHARSPDANRLLHKRRAPLRVLALHSTPAQGDHWDPASLAKHISHLAPALEELDLGQFTVDPIQTRSAPCKIHDPPPPLLKLLLKPLPHLFPALDRTFSVLHGPFTSFTAPEDKGRRWVDDALVFYVLGLRCPVRLAILDVAPGTGSAFTAHYAAGALREHPVPRLKLSLMLDDGLGVFDGLFDSPALAETLTHLTLCLVYDGAERAPEPRSRRPRTDTATDGGAPPCPSWHDLLAKLRCALEPLHRLTHLRLAVYSHAVESKNADDAVVFARALRRCRPALGPGSAEGERHGGEEDEEAGAGEGEEAAAALVRALPSVRYVFLTVSGCLPDPEGGFYREPWCASQAWRVAKLHPEANLGKDTSARELHVQVGLGDVGGEQERGSSTLVALHGDVVETIIWAEELVLSRKDEGWFYANTYE